MSQRSAIALSQKNRGQEFPPGPDINSAQPLFEFSLELLDGLDR
jgi:hypothetical protein